MNTKEDTEAGCPHAGTPASERRRSPFGAGGYKSALPALNRQVVTGTFGGLVGQGGDPDHLNPMKPYLETSWNASFTSAHFTSIYGRAASRDISG